MEGNNIKPENYWEVAVNPEGTIDDKIKIYDEWSKTYDEVRIS